MLNSWVTLKLVCLGSILVGGVLRDDRVLSQSRTYDCFELQPVWSHSQFLQGAEGQFFFFFPSPFNQPTVHCPCPSSSTATLDYAIHLEFSLISPSLRLRLGCEHQELSVCLDTLEISHWLLCDCRHCFGYTDQVLWARVQNLRKMINPGNLLGSL